MFHKSLFGNLNNNIKSILNPVGNTTIPFYNNELKFSIEEYSKLNHFNKNYNYLENKYENLENKYENLLSIEEYIDLFHILSNLEIKIKNSNIKLLLRISRNGLMSTINAFGLNIDNIKSNIKNMILDNKMNSILSTKNETNAIVFSENNYNLEKQFTLSPIFSYYISYFGIPEEGLGFDLDKIQMIKLILENNSIHPFL
jgi:hypothetical protein